MMDDEAFRKLVQKRIIECKWSDISAHWLNFLPSIDPPGSRPDASLSEHSGFMGIASSITNFAEPIKADVPGLREYVLREAIYLLHKSSHVTGCAENQAKQGYKTWSLADAYQASFFGAKAILFFCGIALADFNNKAILIDIFPKEQDIQKRQKQKLRVLDDTAIEFTRLNMKFEHRHVWTMFKRLLDVFQMEVWPKAYIQTLRKLDVKEFAKQRNELHYSNEVWIFDDLHDPIIDEFFGCHPEGMQEALNYNLNSDFSLSLSMAILRMGVLLFESIGESAKVLNAEIQIMRSALTIERHPLYIQNLA